MSEDFVTQQLRMQITEEIALAESSRPDDPVIYTDSGWRPNPTEVKAYEARLLSLLGAVEAAGADRAVQFEVVAESFTVVQLGDGDTPQGPLDLRRR
ncbi:MAG: hypothetical protein ACR2KJ_12925 [Jatrophihabitans sp.]